MQQLNLNSSLGSIDTNCVYPTRPLSSVRLISGDHSLNEAWSTTIHQLDHVNLGQLPAWFMIIKRAYGHTPLYLEVEDADGQYGMLPSYLIRSRLFGTVVTSMPFLDAGGPCSLSESLMSLLIESLIEEASQCGADHLELRCTMEMDLPVAPTTDKVNLYLPLTSDPGNLWCQFDAKVRNQVRKAEHSGLSVDFGRAEKLRDFYEIFTVNMRDLGSPVHSYEFFRSIFDGFGDQARLAMVYKATIPIGGLVALAFKECLSVPWASSLREYRSLCPNMLLYWETLRTACTEGFQRFDFGRSSRNSGTYRFKRQWGALEEPLYWYTIPLGGGTHKRLSGADAQGAVLVRLWQRLPLSLTRRLGPYIRKSLTQ